MSFVDKYNIPPAKAHAALERFIEPKAMNINAMGKRTLKRLTDKGLVKHPVDLYDLDFIKLIRTGVLVGYNASKIKIALDLDHTVNLAGVIYSLNIPNCGLDNSKELAVHYKTLKNFRDNGLEQDDLQLTSEVKDSIADWLNVDYNDAFLELLISRQVGVCEYHDPLLDKPLTGERWYISVHDHNTLSLRKRLIALGGTVSKVLTKKCHRAVLIIGEPELIDKCYRLGVQTYDLREAYKRLLAYEQALPEVTDDWA